MEKKEKNQQVFPMFELVDGQFKPLSTTDENWQSRIWGYEIIPAQDGNPAVILAKKCGEDGNVEDTTWNDFKAFAESVVLEGKTGALPSKEYLREQWTEELRDNIQAMDGFLVEEGADGEDRTADDIDYVGIPWCSEEYGEGRAYFFNLRYGSVDSRNKNRTSNYDRLAVAFNR